MANNSNAFDMGGRSVVLTGATKNIGLATARALARAGADLVVNARSSGPLNEVTDELRQLGDGRVVACPGDVTEPEDMRRLAAVAIDAYGGADVLVNNALVALPHGSLLETPDDVWELGLHGYITGPMVLVRALRESMEDRGRGAIVNLVSTAGFSPVAGLAAYGTMKAALWTLTRYLATELAPSIRVNAVCPGTTSPDGTTGGRETWEALLDIVPLGRMATPDETANAVHFLASDASSYTTGQVIFVDGGRVGLAGSGTTA